MLRNKLFVVTTCLLLLNACGFEPLYGPTQHDDVLTSVTIERIADREGQILRNHLWDMFNPYGKPTLALYRLKAEINLQRQDFAFRRDATSRRVNLNITVKFALTDTALEQVVYQDKVDVDSGFSLGSQANTASLPQVVSEEDAKKRALEQAAREIKLLVSSYIRSHKQQN